MNSFFFFSHRAGAMGEKGDALYLVPALKHGANKSIELSTISLSTCASAGMTFEKPINKKSIQENNEV